MSRGFTGFIAGLGTTFALVVTAMIATHWRPGSTLRAAGVGGFLGLWLTLAWRLHRTALVVGDVGVRVRWLLRTRTIPWTDIALFVTAPDLLVRERLWIVLVNGQKVRTPVQRVGGGFVRAFNDGGTGLRGSRYTTLLDTLNGERQLHGGPVPLRTTDFP